LTLDALRRLLPQGALLARRGRPAVVAVMFLLSFAFFGTEAFVPLAVTTVRGESTTVGGLALSAAAVTWATGSWLPARIAARGWRRELVASGSAFIGLGIVVAALVLLPATPIPVAAIGWAIAGLGMGLAYSTLSLLILETAPPGGEGASSAALQLAFTLGTAFGAGSGGALVALSAVSDLSLALGIALVNALMLIAAAVAVALAWRVPAAVPDRREPSVVERVPGVEPAKRHPEPMIASPAGAACVRDDA
jgi:MFS family permease